MAASTSSPAQAGSDTSRAKKHVHHGKTPAAWVGAMVTLFALLIGAVALVLGPNWILFWIAAVILLAGLVATKVLQMKGYGAD